MQQPARDPKSACRPFIGDNGLDFARNGVRTGATLLYSAFKRKTSRTGVFRGSATIARPIANRTLKRQLGFSLC
jgi:hypothetical protein